MNVGCKNPCEDIERLCVCGTCRHSYEADMEAGMFCNQDIVAGVPRLSDRCQFYPSRWQPYWTDATEPRS